MDKQLARFIYHNVLSIMKNTLNLEELSYREMGRDDPRYKTFKKHLMEFTYSTLTNMFDELDKWGMIVPTEDNESVKNGYKNTSGGGSGYINSQDLSDLLEDLEQENS